MVDNVSSDKNSRQYYFYRRICFSNLHGNQYYKEINIANSSWKFGINLAQYFPNFLFLTLKNTVFYSSSQKRFLGKSLEMNGGISTKKTKERSSKMLNID